MKWEDAIWSNGSYKSYWSYSFLNLGVSFFFIAEAFRLIIIILLARAWDKKGNFFIIEDYMTYVTSDKNDFSKK